MKIGFVTHWYDPEVGSASLSGTISRALARRGDDVRVLTGLPNYPSGRLYPGYSMRPYQRETVRGIDVRRSAIYPNHDRSAVKRMANHLSFAAAGTPVGLATLADRDAVLVFSSPATAAVPAMALRAARGIPYVLHVQDLWPDSVLASGFIGNPVVEGLVRRGIDRFCEQAYQGAHAVAVTSPGMVDLLESRGVPRRKLHVVSNWSDEDAFHPEARDEALAASLGLTAPRIVMYAGNVGEVQGLDILVDAADRLRDLPDVQVALVGDGVARQHLRQEVERRRLDNVVFIDPQPFSAMAKILALGTIQVVSLIDEPLFRMTLPSKLQATLAAGRPVAAALAGDGARLVTDAGAGRTVAPGDGARLAEALRDMLGDEDELRRMGERGRRYYEQHLSEERSASRLLDLLHEAASR